MIASSPARLGDDISWRTEIPRSPDHCRGNRFSGVQMEKSGVPIRGEAYNKALPPVLNRTDCEFYYSLVKRTDAGARRLCTFRRRHVGMGGGIPDRRDHRGDIWLLRNCSSSSGYCEDPFLYLHYFVPDLSDRRSGTANIASSVTDGACASLRAPDVAFRP